MYCFIEFINTQKFENVQHCHNYKAAEIEEKSRAYMDRPLDSESKMFRSSVLGFTKYNICENCFRNKFECFSKYFLL